MSQNAKLNTGILEDVGLEIDTWLDDLLPNGWEKGRRVPHFSNKSTYLALLKVGLNGSVDFSRLIKSIDARIHRNLDSAKRRHLSPENWRFEPHSEFSDENESPEVCLEREIVRQRKMNEWANQSPVASGLLDADSDKGRHVDLVREVERGAIYELIELKWHADNPFFAAMEILCYSLVYLLCREKFPQTDKPLLKANTIHLRVLAPSDYYRSRCLDSKETLLKLQSHISDAIATFAETGGVRMDFRFWEIPNCRNPKDASLSQLKEVAETIVNVGRAGEFRNIKQDRDP